MDERARCIRCREPLDESGECPECPVRREHDELDLDARLRRLREEIHRDREDAPPAEPRSRLWRRKAKQLEKAEGRAEPDEAELRKGDPDGEPDVPSRREQAPEPAAPPPLRGTGARAAGLRARELNVADLRDGGDAVRELLEHRRKGLGRIIGLAGLPRHGKTKLADRLRERYAERPGADLDYDKTRRGQVNIYYLPGHREHHVLVDVAGEDFQALGDYDRDLPALMRRFLWPVLQEIDGLMLLMALPIVWAGWQPRAGADGAVGADGGEGRAEPAEREEIAMRDATRRMVDAHRMLLKYAVVARDLKRLRRAVPHLGLSAEEAPTRDQVDDAFGSAARLGIPVALAFSKADLYATGGRAGLYTPDLPGAPGRPAPPLHPLHTDPVALGHLHFPELFGFLEQRVRFFTFDFVQALVDRSEAPSPHEAAGGAADASRETLLGAEGLVEFVTRHPWRVPGLGTARALALDRKLHPDRWGPGLLRRLHDRDGPRSRGGPQGRGRAP